MQDAVIQVLNEGRGRGYINEKYVHCTVFTCIVSIHSNGSFSLSGVRFAIQASESVLRHAQFTNFGLLDYARIIYSPALQIDYNIHTFTNLLIENGMSYGLTLIHSDPSLKLRF